METVADIINRAGREWVMRELKVKRRQVQAVCRDNLAPASWFDALERRTQSTLDRGLFTFKKADDEA